MLNYQRILVLGPLLPANGIPFHDKHLGLKTPRQNSRWLAAFRDWPVSVPVSNPKPHQKSHASQRLPMLATRKGVRSHFAGDFK